MPRILAAILLVAVLAIGGGLIATTAYQAGLSTAVATAGDSAAVVTPVVVPAYGYGYGWGWHAGFGFFGFLATLFFLFIVFGLIRAAFGWGRGWGRGYGPGGWGPGYGRGHGGRYDAWNDRVREVHDELHRTGGTGGNPDGAAGDAAAPPRS